MGPLKGNAATPKSCAIRGTIRRVREAQQKEDEKRKRTFRVVGKEWAITKLEKENKAKATIKRERWSLGQLNCEIGNRPLCEIEPLTALRRVEARGRYYAVGRLRATASRG